jgi:hypothetical protein
MALFDEEDEDEEDEEENLSIERSDLSSSDKATRKTRSMKGETIICDLQRKASEEKERTFHRIIIQIGNCTFGALSISVFTKTKAFGSVGLSIVHNSVGKASKKKKINTTN